MSFFDTFLAVFSALVITKIVDKIYVRYFDTYVEKSFESIDGVVKKRSERGGGDVF